MAIRRLATQLQIPYPLAMARRAHSLVHLNGDLIDKGDAEPYNHERLASSYKWLKVQHTYNKMTRGYPYAVNFHFTRKCNYNCKFCFHTELSSKIPDIQDAYRVLDMFYAKGMDKINLAGGEPLLYPDYVSKIVKYAKQTLGITVSIVSNASRVKEAWLKEHAPLIDYFAISCDSDNDELNAAMGRRERGSQTSKQTQRTRRVAELCHKYGIKLKINTVVFSENHHIDMSDFITELNPLRWKVFQVLVLGNENVSGATKRDASDLSVSRADFDAFIARHQAACDLAGIRLVPEPNETMQNSYILVDEELRLLDSSSGSKMAGPKVLDVGVDKAMELAGFDPVAFAARDGAYYQHN